MIIIICGLAALTAITALGLYAFKFGFGFASKISDWGAVGDFFGGILNPTFALLSLILIAYTLMQNKKALEQSEIAIQQGSEAIKQNEKALQVSNKELSLTRDELKNSSKALEEQASLLSIQSFETTFFNMLKLHSSLLNNITYDYGGSHDQISKELNINSFTTLSSKGNTPGIFCLNMLLISIRQAHSQTADQQPIKSIFNVFYRYENKKFGSYFRNFYQILKLIKTGIHAYPEQKKYSNILRAQLSNPELALLLLNCVCPHVDKGQFRQLVIHFELLEHLDIVYIMGLDGNETSFIIDSLELFLDVPLIEKYLIFDENKKLLKSAFGKNPEIVRYIDEKGYL